MKSLRATVTLVIEREPDDEGEDMIETEVECKFEVWPGSPGRGHNWHDGGWPADPPCADLVSSIGPDGKDFELTDEELDRATRLALEVD